MLNHASELGINSNQIAIGGESAGGGLTAALTYIQHLQDANVEANCNVYKGMYHAFDMMEPENPTSLQPLFLPRSVDLMKSLLLWQLCSAIYHHNDKLVIDSPMDELLKAIDGRSMGVYLTKEGRALMNNTVEKLISIENQIFDSWSNLQN